MTKRYGVIGDPIAHSLSPMIHNGWLRDMGIDATYEAVHVPDGEFHKALKELEKQEFLGLNVTLPHKASALSFAREVSETASAIGSANTLSFLGQGNWRADNTDAPGFLKALGTIDPASDRALVLGAGGSARAIVFALSEHGVPFTILNRTPARAMTLCTEFGGENCRAGPLDQLTEYIDSATIVINTTSMGYSGEIVQLPKGDGRTFFDISYGKISRPQLTHAAANGWQTRDGLTMLVAQAAYSFEIWFGELPDLEAGMRRCRAAMEAR